MRDVRRTVVSLAATLLWIGCGSAWEAQPGSGAEPPVAEVSAAASQPASAGTVAFTVDGREKRYDSLPDGHNTYTPLGSAIRASPVAGAREQLAITFMAIDLKKLTYPVELPLARKPGQPLDPMAAMANVGFSYIDESGREWAGPGRIRIETFGHDGLVTGSFTNVSLPHTGKQLPNVTLTEGTCRARISKPWLTVGRSRSEAARQTASACRRPP